MYPTSDPVMSVLQDREQQELAVLEKHAQLDRDELQKLQNVEQEIKRARLDQHFRIAIEHDMFKKLAMSKETESKTKFELDKLQCKRDMIRQRLECYERLKYQVKNNVPHEKRSFVKTELPDDMTNHSITILFYLQSIEIYENEGVMWFRCVSLLPKRTANS